MTDTKLFFERLAESSRAYLAELPIADDIEPIAVTFQRLGNEIDSRRETGAAQFRCIGIPQLPIRTGIPAGMNTVGILCDRLTILVTKEYYLRNRGGDATGADKVLTQHIPEITATLAIAQPGEAELLAKVSSLPADIALHDFFSAYYGLLEANILMWETQEVLYLKDINVLPADEIRDYIRFFSLANMRRNKCIEYAEGAYWNNKFS